MVTEIEKKILTKMFYGRFIGARHTSEDNIPKGFPKHERGNVKKALRNLKRQGYVTLKSRATAWKFRWRQTESQKYEKSLTSNILVKS